MSAGRKSTARNERCLVHMPKLPHRPTRTRLALCAGATLLLLPPVISAADAGAGCRLAGPPLPADVPTLSVSIKAERSAYRHGQTAVLPIEVRVGGPGGPRVAGADLELTVTASGRPVKTLNSRTSTDGTAKPRLKITGTVPSGTLTAEVTARAVLVPGSDCTPGLVYQVGRGGADPLTTVKD